jgi:hypothetical protein
VKRIIALVQSELVDREEPVGRSFDVAVALAALLGGSARVVDGWVRGEEHAWVEYRGYILDIYTPDAKLQKVVLRRADAEMHYLGEYSKRLGGEPITKVAESICDAVRAQLPT